MFIVLVLAVITIFQGSGEPNVNKNGIAISGYDVVAYFDSEPKEGDIAYQIRYEGGTYLFSSQTNKDAFEAEPTKFIPQYGGWCAYAMGLGSDKVKINPERYKILRGKLYLFYDFKGTDTLIFWEKDEESLKRAADKNWKKIQIEASKN